MFVTVVEELLRDGHGVRFVATGDSMAPSILAGDTLVIEPVRADSLNRGEIVLVRTSHALRAHRIVAVRDGCVILRGDSALRTDPPFALDNVLGRVTGVERDGASVDLPATMPLLAVLVRRFLRFARHRLR